MVKSNLKKMETNHISKGRRLTSYIMSGLVILFMLMDSTFIFVISPESVDANMKLRYSDHHLVTMGILGLIPTWLYLLPRTSILGVVLLPFYFGGAVARHFMVDHPLFSHTLFPFYLHRLTP